MSLIIRPADPGEAHALTALAHLAKGHWGYPESWMRAWRDQLTLTPEYLLRHRAYAGLVGPRLAALYALEDEGDAWSLGHFWVDPRWMGQGIGRWMLSDAVRRVRALRPGPLRIASDPHAEGFYLKMGARRVGAVPADVDGTKRELPLLELDTGRWEEGITFEGDARPGD